MRQRVALISATKNARKLIRFLHSRGGEPTIGPGPQELKPGMAREELGVVLDSLSKVRNVIVPKDRSILRLEAKGDKAIMDERLEPQGGTGEEGLVDFLLKAAFNLTSHIPPIKGVQLRLGTREKGVGKVTLKSPSKRVADSIRVPSIRTSALRSHHVEIRIMYIYVA